MSYLVTDNSDTSTLVINSLFFQSSLSKSEIEDIREVFDLFDFWDGRDGMVDANKVGDLLRCSGMNPTVSVTVKHGATEKPDLLGNQLLLNGEGAVYSSPRNVSLPKMGQQA
ncbi:hypothetical protein X801_03490 [Opisthorchis viverrini]|uniref:EF-hand domain-containing protein n=1 Tax=Opisthorchis viverrini TaxID=6198 RepID=A0A1S8X1N6_OPIVI|nr:hypothetical protein X801_03490 [Opisthorchis viverrini]